jgi:type IV secretory pathway VirB4 component
MAFYVRGDDPKTLRANVNQLNALLLPNGLQPILQEADLLALDSYIRNLPMAYDVSLDKISRRSRLVFSSHTANLLPLYGRSKGTGHPGLVFFNRGAEPLVFDPLHREDRKKNAHMLILGPTGAGKSALLVYLLQQIARFKDLTDVQRSLLLSARKEPGKYVEGVVLSDNLEALFRNVPPPLSLALAVTEKHEKAERAEIMREQNCSELEAVYIIAERIGSARR